MKIEIKYSKSSEKFLSKNSGSITEEEVDKLIIQSVKILTNKEPLTIDLKTLKGEYKGYYRIRKGKIRIIFKIEGKQIILASVNNIGFRGDVY